MSNASGFDPISARDTPPVAALNDRACNGVNPEIFYPKYSAGIGDAIAICDRCPHRQPCLDWALETRQSYGVWGGFAAEARSKMLRRMA